MYTFRVYSVSSRLDTHLQNVKCDAVCRSIWALVELKLKFCGIGAANSIALLLIFKCNAVNLLFAQSAAIKIRTIRWLPIRNGTFHVCVV